MSLKTVQEEWEGFWEMVKPKDACEVQEKEMKKAFFAGAYTTMVQVNEVGKSQYSDSVSMAHLNSIMDECEKFHRDLISKYAQGN